MRILGVDPGLAGALALIVDGKPTAIYDMPTVQRNKTGNAQMVNGAELARILCEWAPIDHALVELVKGMPRVAGPPCPACKQAKGGMGATSAFNFGRGFGAIEQAMHSGGIPFTLVPPEVWKRRAGLIGAEKDASRTEALRLWPSLAAQLKRKKDGGRAEAALIARYGLKEAPPREFADPFNLDREPPVKRAAPVNGVLL